MSVWAAHPLFCPSSAMSSWCFAKDADYDRRVAVLIGPGKYEAGAGKGMLRDIPVDNVLAKLATQPASCWMR